LRSRCWCRSCFCSLLRGRRRRRSRIDGLKVGGLGFLVIGRLRLLLLLLRLWWRRRRSRWLYVPRCLSCRLSRRCGRRCLSSSRLDGRRRRGRVVSQLQGLMVRRLVSSAACRRRLLMLVMLLMMVVVLVELVYSLIDCVKFCCSGRKIHPAMPGNKAENALRLRSRGF
jgi:hypothetical protein